MGIQTRQCVPSHEPLLYVFLLHIYLVFFGVFQGFEAFFRHYVFFGLSSNWA